MQSLMKRSWGRVLVAGIVVLLLFVGGAADAKSKSKVKKSNGRLVALDEGAGTMTVKEKGKKVVYDVKLEGSVMTRTTSTMNAKPVKLTEIPLNAPIIVYWIPDENDRKKRFARKVDAPKIPKEFLDDIE